MRLSLSTNPLELTPQSVYPIVTQAPQVHTFPVVKSASERIGFGCSLTYSPSEALDNGKPFDQSDFGIDVISPKHVEPHGLIFIAESADRPARIATKRDRPYQPPNICPV